MDTNFIGKAVKLKSGDKFIQNFLVLEQSGDRVKIIHEDLLEFKDCEQWVELNSILVLPDDGDVEPDNNRSLVYTVPSQKLGEPDEIKVDENQLKIFSRTCKNIPEWKPERELKPFSSLKRFHLDIETTGLDPENDRIIYAGLKASGYKNLKNNYKLITHPDEKIILKEFVETFKKHKPEALIGFNFFDFDLPFIIRRCEKLNIKHEFKVSDYFTTVSTAQKFGEATSYRSIYLNGTSLIDVYHLVLSWDNVFRKLTSHSLKQSVLQMKLREETRLELDHEQINECWKNGDLEPIEEYLKYDLDDTELLSDALFPSIYYQQIFVPGMNLQRLATAGNGTKWQAVLEEQYPNKGKGVVEPDEPLSYEGGYTVGYAGLWRNVSKVDVSSLYPSIMLTYGITSEKDTDYKLLGILRYLLTERLRLKALGKTDKNAKQLEGALKILINSAYGALGTKGIGYNDFKAAALVTAYGRMIAKLMVEIIEREGGVIVEVDTDGVMFSCLPGQNKKIYEVVKNSLPSGIGLTYEFEAKAVFIPPSDSDPKIGIRKNYLVFIGDEVEAKGKFRKRDVSTLEKTFQIDYLKKYLDNPDVAESFFQDTLKQIQSGEYDIDKLKITRKIRRLEKELLKFGSTGKVISYYETEHGRDIKGDYSITYYQEKLLEMRKDLLKMIDPDLLLNNVIIDKFINNNAVQLSLFS